MLGIRFEPLGPFWLEDLVFLALDEIRRLPRRMLKVAAQMRRQARKALELDPYDFLPSRNRANTSATKAPARKAVVEASRIDAPEAWTLATEPLTAVGIGTSNAIAMHAAAGNQLDAISYVLDRIRDDVRPLMTYAHLPQDEPRVLHVEAEFEASLEALLDLARRNAATRPKNRITVGAA